jgi:Heavy metal associated domain 2
MNPNPEHSTVPRYVKVVHNVPGRTRLRCSWLRESRDAALEIADALVTLPGMEEVVARPFTGSVLCRYNPLQLSPEQIADEARAAGGAEVVLRSQDPDPAPLLRDDVASIARVVARIVHDLNQEVLRATDSKTDLGILATLGFMTAGAAEVVTRKVIPSPPWFNLAWWGFRTFMTTEERAISDARESRENSTEAASH